MACPETGCRNTQHTIPSLPSLNSKQPRSLPVPFVDFTKKYSVFHTAIDNRCLKAYTGTVLTSCVHHFKVRKYMLPYSTLVVGKYQRQRDT